MKNTVFLAIAALFFSAAASAQSTTDTSKVQPATTPAAATPATPSNWAKVDDNLPAHLKGVTSSTVEPKHFLPVLGSFQPSGTSTANLTVSVDEQNIGIVWIDGLPQGRVKAILKKAPATYKIPAQKTADGKSVAEGTLIYDKEANQLSICTNCPFNEENPSAPFTGTTTTSTKKSKVWTYTGSKVDATATTTTQQAPVQQQQ